MALLKNIKFSTKTLKWKLENSVVDDFNRAVIEAKTAGFRLDITDQVEKLVIAATKQAREELDERKLAANA